MNDDTCPVCGKGEKWLRGAVVSHLDCVRQEHNAALKWRASWEQAEAERDELEKMLRLEYADLLDEAGGHLSVSIDDWLADLRRRVRDA